MVLIILFTVGEFLVQRPVFPPVRKTQNGAFETVVVEPVLITGQSSGSVLV
jgi:hypothetical protein